MKRVSFPGKEPPLLQNYRENVPASTWEQLKADAMHQGREAYAQCRDTLISAQGGLCAYCEIGIHDNNPLTCRIEHFHPKSDRPTAPGEATEWHNWALDWNNLLAVCAGGSYKHGKAPHTLHPIGKNLSCDAHKDKMIQAGKLPEQCEHWILNPREILANPCLFKLNTKTGELIADPAHCITPADWNNAHHSSLTAQVEHTIAMLHLNCSRLCNERIALYEVIEKDKQQQRQAGKMPEEGMANLVAKYFQQRWPPFFTTRRLLLGAAAERYLGSINFQG